MNKQELDDMYAALRDAQKILWDINGSLENIAPGEDIYLANFNQEINEAMEQIKIAKAIANKDQN